MQRTCGGFGTETIRFIDLSSVQSETIFHFVRG
jgi:hypothetical protein